MTNTVTLTNGTNTLTLTATKGAREVTAESSGGGLSTWCTVTLGEARQTTERLLAAGWRRT